MKALFDDGKLGSDSEDDIDQALDAGDVTVEVEGTSLERTSTFGDDSARSGPVRSPSGSTA